MKTNAFYSRFCKETFDANGVLTNLEVELPEDFQFAYDVVGAVAKAQPARRALVWCNDKGEEKTMSFGEIEQRSNQCAQMLAARGVIKGDFVLVSLRRHYEFWITMLALEKLGAVAVPTHHALPAKELLQRLQAANITACVVSGEGTVAAAVDEACAEYSSMRAKWVVCGAREGWLQYEDELAQQNGAWTRQKLSKSEPMSLYFTSGTAAEPKMVLHDHTYPAAHIVTGRYWSNLSEDDLHLTVAETGWMKALWGKLYAPWWTGAAVMVYDFERFSASNLLKVMQAHRVTTFCAPAVIYRFLVQENLRDCDLSALRYTTTAGEPMPPDVFFRWKEQTGLCVMESFGQTETAMLAAHLVGTQPKPGSMGRPCPGCALRLVDEDGLDVPAGAVGELCVDTSETVLGLFQGYYRDEEATKAVWHDHLYHTGDMAWMDEEGYLWYIGRTDDIIKASGYRIGPVEIETVLLGHPAVLECAVTGAPDTVRGTVVKASVVPAQGYAASEALEKELQEFVKKHTAAYKYPRVVAFVEKLPRTLSGKIRRAEIRAQDYAAFQK